MNAFRRVVELNSFHAAAASLGLTGGAVSKLVTQLEADLGAQLLHRTTRSVRVSDEGRAFYEAAVRILDDLDASAEAVRSGAAQPVGRLRVSVPTSFALMWLAPRLPRFLVAWPRLEMDLVLNDRFVDMVQDDFDCAIRITDELPDSSLVARRLGQMERVLVAAPEYLAHAPPLQRPEDLTAHACLLYSLAATPNEWPLRGTASGRPVRVSGTCRVNNSVMLRDLLQAGLGVSLTPEVVVRDLLAAGELVELLPAHRPAPHTISGVVPQQRHQARKVRLFLDFVAQALNNEAQPTAASNQAPTA